MTLKRRHSCFQLPLCVLPAKKSVHCCLFWFFDSACCTEKFLLLLCWGKMCHNPSRFSNFSFGSRGKSGDWIGIGDLWRHRGSKMSGKSLSIFLCVSIMESLINIFSLSAPASRCLFPSYFLPNAIMIRDYSLRQLVSFLWLPWFLSFPLLLAQLELPLWYSFWWVSILFYLIGTRNKLCDLLFYVLSFKTFNA